ncbi:uncharacterized protein LOC112086110 [Eutrema salsugineum]|uniref:uncharacterized protein LOC112086110 n=1 Tax=Eutrema salsugineum TaxID=72664 RepID=UPI000CED44FF|nr:uncharacterized protein LOC112086110 [Eutrema salsugineum]
MVASVLHDVYPGRLDTPVAKSIINVVQGRIGMNVSYSTALRGKKLAFNYVRGSPEDSNGMLYPYLHMLEKVNLGTVTSVELTAEKNFKYFFIALGACVEGFRAMRKVLVVDATFLSGSYGGMLVFATAQDPNRHNYPVAFGVIDGENNRSWRWFFEKLKTVVPDDPKVRFPKAAEYLDNSVTLEKWARCCFLGDKYNIETSNLTESMNSCLVTARKYTLLHMIDAIVAKVSEWFNRYRKDSAGPFYNKRVGPVVENEIHSRCAIASLLVVTELNSYELEYSVNGLDGKTYVVNLIAKSCCCRRFDIDKFPCEHAIAAAKKLMSTEDRSASIGVYDLCSKYYLIETWTLAYYRKIYPVPHHTDWSVPDNIKELVVLPLDVKKKVGRNQEKRKPGPGEHCRRTKNKADPHLDLEACFRSSQHPQAEGLST